MIGPGPARAPRGAAALALAACALASAACGARPAPADPSTRALLRDLERHVTIAAATGWGTDRSELAGMLDGALDSVCRVDPLARRSLRAWLAAEIAALGGPVERAWRERGRRLDRVADLLVVTRIEALLAAAEGAIGDCPFWLEPERPFRGRQISQHRFQLSFGGGGKGIVVRQGARTDLSAGGAGRVLVGRALGGDHALYTGFELGGSATFPRDPSGERAGLVLGIDLVAPVVYRRMGTNAYFELEAGWLGRATEQDWGRLEHGIHVGAALGARALRTRFVFPGAALGISWERTLEDGADVTLFKVGARVAFDLDL
jgi:hypothetical protein